MSLINTFDLRVIEKQDTIIFFKLHGSPISLPASVCLSLF